MNSSLPDELKAFVDQRIQADGYGTSSEYMHELIRRFKDRQQFRQYLLDGMNAPAAGAMEAEAISRLTGKATWGTAFSISK